MRRHTNSNKARRTYDQPQNSVWMVGSQERVNLTVWPWLFGHTISNSVRKFPLFQNFWILSPVWTREDADDLCRRNRFPAKGLESLPCERLSSHLVQALVY